MIIGLDLHLQYLAGVLVRDNPNYHLSGGGLT